MHQDYGKLLKEKKKQKQTSTIEKKEKEHLAQIFHKKSKNNEKINYSFFIISLFISVCVIIFFNLFYGIILIAILGVLQFILIEPLKIPKTSNKLSTIMIELKPEDKWHKIFDYLKNLQFIDLNLLQVTHDRNIESLNIIKNKQLSIHETFDFHKNIDYLYEYIENDDVDFNEAIVQEKFNDFFKTSSVFFEKYHSLLKNSTNDSVINSININKMLSANKIQKIDRSA